MQVSVEKTSNLGRRLTIDIPAAQVETEQSNKINDLAKTMKVDGFRPGKVPKRLVQERYGKEVRQETISKILEKSLVDALTQEKLNPASRPNVEDVKEESEGVKYIVSFEIYPEIELKDFSEIVLEKLSAEISEEDLDKGVARMQDQFATWSEAERAAKLDDQVTIDFVGYKDDVAFEGGTANDVDLILGSGQFIPGFEDGLVGVAVGDSKTLDLTFPENYGSEDLAGQAVQFKVEVKKVSEKNSAELNEELAKNIGIEDGDVNKIRDTVRENMSKYLDDVIQQKLREQVLDKFAEVNPIDVPESIVDQEKKAILGNMQQQNQGATVEGEALEQVEQDARKRAALGLLLNEVVRKHELKPDESRVQAKIKELAVMFGNAEMIEKMYYESKELLQNVQNMVLTDQATDLIVDGASLEEKQSTFYDIVEGSAE